MLEISGLIIVAVSLLAFYVARNRARAVGAGDFAGLHSLPSYHGLYGALWTFIIGFAAIIVFTILANIWINSSLIGALPEDVQQLSELRKDRLLSETDPLGNTSTNTYNAASDLIETADPLGHTVDIALR